MSHISEKNIFDFLGLLYESARENSLEAWLNVYGRLENMFSSGPGGFSIYDESIDRFEVPIHTIDPQVMSDYFAYYQKVSPFLPVLTTLGEGGHFSRTAAMSDAKFVSTEIYHGFYQRSDIFNFEHNVLLKKDGVLAAICLTRPRTLSNFSKVELKALSFILPHLSRAFQAWLNLSDLQLENRILGEAMSKIPQSVIVVDKSGKVVYANESANTILAAKDGLELDRNDGLKASLVSETQQLRLLLNGIFRPELDKPNNHGGAIQISRPSGLRNLQVMVCPFSEQSVFGINTGAIAILFLHDPGQHTETVEGVLRQMYGLTTAEARLAAILANGKSLNEACDLLEVSQNTARTHLKHIFSKTDTNRQSDLVTLIMNGPANLKS